MQDKQKEILDLTIEMMKFPSISVGEEISIEGIRQCYSFITNYLKKNGLRVVEFDEGGKTPALYCDCSKSSSTNGNILLTGHFDKVSPASPSQLLPSIEGDWLKGRGSADMLTVVATYMVFMKDLKKKAGDLPGIGLLLVGNEEPGEYEKWGTPHILDSLKQQFNYKPSIMIVGERTGEGAEKTSKIENKNRGIIRIHLESFSKAAHTALVQEKTAMDIIFELKDHITNLIPSHRDSIWKTSFMLSYLLTGQTFNFNINPQSAKAGFEIRPIPEDDISSVVESLTEKANELGVKIKILNNEKGVSTPPSHPLLKILLDAAATVNGGNPSNYLGNGKLPGSQARFAPPRCASVVFGQSGVGPHTNHEAHYIPSILPYYKILWEILNKRMH